MSSNLILSVICDIMKVICGIYCIENIINKKKYIGQSIDINRRWSQHKNELKNNNHANQHLQNAWNKYGENNFHFYIIKSCKKRYLNRLEKLYIRQYNSYHDGYNLDNGGNVVLGFLGKKHSDKTKEIMSDIKKQQYKGKGNPMYGKHHSLESQIKTSKSLGSSGVFRVSKHIDKRKRQGFCWEYTYRDDNGKKKRLCSIDINILKSRVLNLNLPWIEY